ncbi:hypothetical protein AB0B63_07125 [Micromonospora sp. NPDC049081]|uniref:hypothetical protein n=1 Tax=Micromonospora sp. NPDC049081 TaxID=3155150 RepID=UPI0033F73813
MTAAQTDSRWTLANTNTTGGTMDHEHFDPALRFDELAYDAAYHALTGRLDGDIAETAMRVTAAVCELWEMYTPGEVKRYALDANVRAPLVIGLLAAVELTDWPRVRPLLDSAVAAAALALWDGPNAVRHNYPLPGETA